MSKKVKILLVLLGVLVLTSVGFIIWQQKTQASEEEIGTTGSGDFLSNVGRTIQRASDAITQAKGREVDKGYVKGWVKEKIIATEKGKDKEKKVPVSGVMVEVILATNLKKSVVATGVSDNNGGWIAGPVKPRSPYSVEFSHDGYAPTSVNINTGVFYEKDKEQGVATVLLSRVNYSTGKISGNVTYNGLPLSPAKSNPLGAVKFTFPSGVTKPEGATDNLEAPIFGRPDTAKPGDPDWHTEYSSDSFPVGSYTVIVELTTYPEAQKQRVSFEIKKGTPTVLPLNFKSL